MAVPESDERHRLRVRGIGSIVQLIIDGDGAPELLDRLARAWSRCLLPAPDAPGPDGPSPTADLLVTLDSDPPATAAGDRVAGADPETVMVHTTQAITRLLIESQTGRLLMLHAGAVAHPETGQTVVFVAPGGTGKTTLVRTLADRYGYLSDETVAIDADYRVLPYPKPLSVRRPGAPKQELSPDELGLIAAPAEPTVVRLCLLDRDDRHAGPPEVTPLDLLDAITELTPQSSALYALPDGLRTLARLIVATGPVLRLRYAEATDLLPLIDELLASTPGDLYRTGDPRLRGDDEEEVGDGEEIVGNDLSSPPDGNTTPESAGSSPRPPSSPPRRGSQQPVDPDLRVHANRFADTLERDGEALVLLGEGGLLRLNPLGAAIVEFALNPIRLDALAVALERRFGAPDGAGLLEATAQRVHELAEQGVLTLGEPELPDAPGPFWRIADDVAQVLSTPDRVVVFNLATPTEQPEALIGTAATIWQYLIGDEDTPRPWTSEPLLIADLADAYTADPAAITPDVQAFLARMHATGHLESRSGGGGCTESIRPEVD